MILISYFGCLKGKVNESMCLIFVGERFFEVLGKEVKKCDDCIGEEVIFIVMVMKDGDVVLLENVCFYFGEEGNDLEFVK